VPGEKDEKVWRERDGKVRDLRVCKERNGIADVLLPVCHVCREGGETLTIPPLDPRPTCCPLPLRLVHVGLAAPHVQISPSFHSFISLTPCHSCSLAYHYRFAPGGFSEALHLRVPSFFESYFFLLFVFFFPSVFNLLTSLTAPVRGYADAATKFSRAKPHMNIGTIGSTPFRNIWQLLTPRTT
jgi:hypothetical protein